jgi:hypothetical protein
MPQLTYCHAIFIGFKPSFRESFAVLILGKMLQSVGGQQRMLHQMAEMLDLSIFLLAPASFSKP